MAKFVFKLQSVLNIKKQLEEQQRMELAAASKRLYDAKEYMDSLRERLLNYEEYGRVIQKDALNVTELKENRYAIARVNEYISEQENVIADLEAKLEFERSKLVNAIKERKMYEKLRENALEEFSEELNHAESIENDEHNSFVYGAAGRNQSN